MYAGELGCNALAIDEADACALRSGAEPKVSLDEWASADLVQWLSDNQLAPILRQFSNTPSCLAVSIREKADLFFVDGGLFQ